MTDQHRREKIEALLNIAPVDKMVSLLENDGVWEVLFRASEIETDIEIALNFKKLKTNISKFNQYHRTPNMDFLTANVAASINRDIVHITHVLARAIQEYDRNQAEQTAEALREKKKDDAETLRFNLTHSLNRWTLAFTIILGATTIMQAYFSNEKDKEIEALKEQVKDYQAKPMDLCVEAPKAPVIAPVVPVKPKSLPR